MSGFNVVTGLVVEFRPYLLPVAAAGSTHCELDPEDCCVSGGSGSGGSVESVCCPGVLLPASPVITLSETPAGIGGCPGLGVTLAATWDPASLSYLINYLFPSESPFQYALTGNLRCGYIYATYGTASAWFLNGHPDGYYWYFDGGMVCTGTGNVVFNPYAYQNQQLAADQTCDPFFVLLDLYQSMRVAVTY